MNWIFIERRADRELSGYVRNGKLIDFYIDNQSYHKSLGNIYRGKVKNVIRGMDAAFVDLGMAKNAYLNKKSALPKNLIYEENQGQIVDFLKSGEDIIVQVIKEPVASKGAKITRHIELPGRYIVLTPFSNKVNISRKIVIDEELDRLNKIANDIKKEDIGFIIRTAAEGEDKEVIKKEYEKLYEIYREIKKQKNFLPSPKLIYRSMSKSKILLRDNLENISKIIVNSEELFNEIKLLLGEKNLEDKELKIDEKFSVDYNVEINDQIKEALSNKIILENGASIVIDEVEALTAIDVNTEGFIDEFSKRRTVLKTNLEAAEEIGRQIRLRNIGGMIIIDFIRMKEKEDLDEVLETLNNVLREDNIRSSIFGETRLGLVEITRKKTGRTLIEDMTIPCNECKGMGNIRIF